MAGPWEDYKQPAQDQNGPWSDYGTPAEKPEESIKTSPEGTIYGGKPLPLPGTVKQPEPPQPKSAVRNVLDTIIGAGETAAAVGTGTVGGLAAAWRHPFDEKAQSELAGKMTYAPRSDTGRQMTKAAGEVLGPLTGAMPEMSRIAAARAPMNSPLPKPPREAITPEKVAIPKQMVDAGIKVPPSMSNPNRGLLANILEGWGGKVATQQKASAMNAETFNRMAAKDLGLPEGTAITKQNVQPIFRRYGDLRAQIDNFGTKTPSGAPIRNLRFKPDETLQSGLSKVVGDAVTVAKEEGKALPPGFSDLEGVLKKGDYPPAYIQAKVRTLRDQAADNFKPGGDTQLARAQKATAVALEDFLERRIQQSGDPKLLKDFQDMRKQTAKAYDYLEAANDLGDVSAVKLAKGDTDRLTGNASTIATAGGVYPKASQTVSGMGGYQPHSAVSAGAAGLEAMQGNPSGLASALGILAGRPLARNALLSNWGQRRWAIPQPPQTQPSMTAQLMAAQRVNPWLLLQRPPDADQ